MPPLVTARVDARIALPNLAIEADTPAELSLEDGSVRPVTIRGGKAATVPAIGQPGYHRLRFAGREITLAVAPPRCVTLEEVGAGRRMWGVAAQIYGLRRAGDGGIGDAGAVRDLAEACGAPWRRRRGAEPGAWPVRRRPGALRSLFAVEPAVPQSALRRSVRRLRRRQGRCPCTPRARGSGRRAADRLAGSGCGEVRPAARPVRRFCRP